MVDKHLFGEVVYILEGCRVTFLRELSFFGGGGEAGGYSFSEELVFGICYGLKRFVCFSLYRVMRILDGSIKEDAS